MNTATHKWCSGACGRFLPRTGFYTNGNGDSQGRCKSCHRVAERARYANLYRNNKAFREYEQARKRGERVERPPIRARVGTAKVLAPGTCPKCIKPWTGDTKLCATCREKKKASRRARGLVAGGLNKEQANLILGRS